VWGARPVPELEKLAAWIYRPINLHYEAGQSMAAHHVDALLDYTEYSKSGNLAAARATVPSWIAQLRRQRNPCFVGRDNCTVRFVLALYSHLCRGAEVGRWMPLGGFASGLEVLSAWRPDHYKALTSGQHLQDRSCLHVWCDPELTNVSLFSRTGSHPTTARQARCCRELSDARDDSCAGRPHGICRSERFRGDFHGAF